MMDKTEYIIDEMIVFCTGQEKIFAMENPEIEMILPPACAYLLTIFLQNKGVVLSREKIHDLFWSNLGTTISGNSMNAYVSTIRKSFSTLGVTKEVIKTVYKIGFVFNPDVNLQVRTLPTDESANSKTLATSPDVKTLKARLNSKLHKSSSYIFNIGFLITVINILFIFYIVIYWAPKKIMPVSIGLTADNCTIEFLPQHDGERVLPAKNISDKIVSQSKFVCKSGGKYYIYADGRVLNGKSGNIFVSYCSVFNSKKISCHDYMEHGWSSSK